MARCAPKSLSGRLLHRVLCLLRDGRRWLKLCDIAAKDFEQQPPIAATRLFEEADQLANHADIFHMHMFIVLQMFHTDGRQFVRVTGIHGRTPHKFYCKNTIICKIVLYWGSVQNVCYLALKLRAKRMS